MAPSKNDLRAMVTSFKENDLKLLLETFGFKNNFPKHKLLDKALELLRNNPTAVNFSAYTSKIVDIYRLAENNNRQSMLSIGLVAQQIRLFPNCPPAYSVFPKNANKLRNIKIVKHQDVLRQSPTNQQTVRLQLTKGLTLRTEIKNGIMKCGPPVQNFSFKKLLFYETVDKVLKPTILFGVDKCTLPYFPMGTNEFELKFKLSFQRVLEIVLNSQLSRESPQILIRLGVLEDNSSEITDCMPQGLFVRVNGQVCPLPALSPQPLKPEARRILPCPITFTKLLKLDSTIFNQSHINWYPDEKTYAIEIIFVSRLSADTLVEKLKHRRAKSVEETTKDIVAMSTVNFTDLVTTCHSFSLMCPLSKLKMKVPTKSVNCKHLQCFDAGMFISMNEQKPTWVCPICGESCSFDELQIQTYFLEIVNSELPRWCKEIKLLADGSWKEYMEPLLTDGQVNNECRPHSDVINLTLSGYEEPPQKKIKIEAIDSAMMKSERSV